MWNGREVKQSVHRILHLKHFAHCSELMYFNFFLKHKLFFDYKTSQTLSQTFFFVLFPPQHTHAQPEKQAACSKLEFS